MSTRLVIDRNSPVALHRQIYETIKQAILSGSLGAGTRLLPSRVLAKYFEVSRNTLMCAIDQLVADGYLIAKIGSGTFVKSRPAVTRVSANITVQNVVPSKRSRVLAESAAHVVSACNCGGPLCPFSLHPQHLPFGGWKKALRRVLASQNWDIESNDPAGYLPLRQAILDMLAQTRGINATAQQVFLFDGTQSTLAAITAVLFDPGDVAVVEDPGFPGAYSAFESAGAKIAAIPPFTDDAIEAMRRLAKIGPVKGCFVTPTHHMPLGNALPRSERIKLLDWAASNATWIIEDDFGCDFHYGAGIIPALQSLDRHGRVLHAGTLTNTVGPLVRLSYLVVPNALTWAFRAVRALHARTTIDIGHVALTEMFKSGNYSLHLRRCNAAFEANRQALLEAFARLPSGVLISPSMYGTSISLLFDEGFAPDDAVVRAAREEGLCVCPISTFSRSSRRNGIMVGFTSSDLATTALAAKKLVLILEHLRHKRPVAV